MKKYKAFIFDLDGTLVDSSPSIYGSLRNLEKAMGLTPLPETTLYKFVGPPLADSFRNYYHATDDQIPHMLEIYREDYRENTIGLSVVYPGVVELLSYLKEQGCLVGVATLKHQETAQSTMERAGLNRYIDCMTALTDDKKSSKGALINECIEIMGGVPKEQVIFFGDSPYDGIGAREAGVDFVALTYGFGFLDPGSLDGIPHILNAVEPMMLVDFAKRTAMTKQD